MESLLSGSDLWNQNQVCESSYQLISLFISVGDIFVSRFHNCGCNKKRSFTRMGSRKHPCGASSEERVNWAVIFEHFKTRGKTAQWLAMAAYESFYITWVNSPTGSYRAGHLPEWLQGKHWAYHDFHIITLLFMSFFPWAKQLHISFLWGRCNPAVDC